MEEPASETNDDKDPCQQCSEQTNFPDEKDELHEKNQELSSRQKKKKLRAEKRRERMKELKILKKEIKMKKKAEDNKQNNIELNSERLDETEYYFENGLRKVYPYCYVFSCYAKGRWVNRNIGEVIGSEFGLDSDDEMENAFKEGRITVNNQKVSEDYKLQNHDYLSHKLHRHENPVTAAPIEILADTDNVLVVNKPSSIPTHPCGRYRYNSMQSILKKEYGYPNLLTTHRLDRLTSGVLIFSKTYEQATHFKELLTQRQMEKEYVCRVEGEFPEGNIKVDQPLEALWNKVRLQIISPKGKPSCTHFKRLSFNGRSSVVRCYPKTGRTHQIRVHLQYLGHPIINDYFYNSAAWGPNGGKGGDYKVDFQELCKKITEEHMATVWEKGENPLYVQKFGNQEFSQVNATSDIKEERIQDESAPKRAKLECNTNSLEHCQSLTIDHSVNNPKVENIKSETDACSKICDGNLILNKTSCNESEKDSSDSKLYRPLFDKQKMILEKSCSTCKKNLIDPSEKHLTMFLHACLYKGNDWKYETGLPEWAHPDWCREDDFMLK